MSIFQNGKIYKITSETTKYIYIGSTIKELNIRLYEHIIESKNENKKTTSKILIREGTPKIELIENYPCETKRDLLIREGEHILQNKNLCINKNIAGRTFRADYKEYKNQYHKKYNPEYYKKNKHRIIAQTKAYKANKRKI